MERVSEVTERAILGFFGPYYPLSNFYIVPVVYRGLGYPSNENAFHAAKTGSSHRKDFTKCTPLEAKRLGRALNIDVVAWEAKRVRVMVEICLDKFTRNEELRDLLLATGSRYLEETNDWGDTFWGVCNGKGLNVLGRIHMEIRSLIRYSSCREVFLTQNIRAICKEVQRQITVSN